MQIAHPLRWQYEIAKVQIISPPPDPDNGHMDSLSRVWRAPITYAAHVAEITEGLIEYDFLPQQSIGIAALAACTTPVENAGYAAQLDKCPSDNGAYEEAFDLLEKTWAFGKELEQWRARAGSTDWTPQVQLLHESNRAQWYTLEHATMQPVDVPFIDTSPLGDKEYVDGHLLVDMYGSQITEYMLRSSAWIKKEIVVKARQARKTEEVTTILNNGTVETTNIANEGDWIVTNPGGESYAMPDAKFKARHRSKEGKHGHYVTIGDGMYVSNPFGVPVCTRTPWNPDEFMFGDKDCGFVAAFDPTRHAGRDTIMQTADRYIIGRKEKLETYRPAIYFDTDLITDDADIQAVLPVIVNKANITAYDPYAEDLLAKKFGRVSLTRRFLSKVLG